MASLNPMIVSLARESRGLTQSELARLAGVRQGTLSKIEHGQTEPSAEIAQAIADALNYPVALLFEDIAYRNLPVSFYRKRARTPLGLMRTIAAKINLIRLHVRKLLQSVEPPEVRLPLVDLTQRRQSPEAIARELRIRWHVPPGPAPNLIELLESMGVLVAECDFGTDEIDAISLNEPQDGVPPMIFVSSRVPGDRQRFSIAHETGHIVLHHHLPLPDTNIEAEADSFASEFLMPSQDVSPQLNRLNLRKLAGLKPHWKVSMQALLKRAEQLGKISERQRRYLWVQMARHGYRTKEPFPIPREQPTLISELVSFHLTHLGYSEGELCEVLRLHPEELHMQYLSSGQPLRLVPRSGGNAKRRSQKLEA